MCVCMCACVGTEFVHLSYLGSICVYMYMHVLQHCR